MSTLSNYKKEAKKLFIISVKKDIEKWSDNGNYNSPKYNNSCFFIDKYDFFNVLRINDGSYNSERICLINWLFIPFNIKVFYYYLKLKIHFRKKERDEKVAENIKNIKRTLDNMKPNFVKEIRKEKLDNLK